MELNENDVLKNATNGNETVQVTETVQGEQPPVRRTPRRLHKNKTQYMVTLAMLIALVVVLQFVGAMIPPIGPTSLSFVLIPIVIGGLVLGVKAGGILGLAFGLVTIIRGLAGMDALTTHLLYYNDEAINMVLTILVCLVKGIAAGVVPPLVHGLLHRRLPHASVFVSAAVAPFVNTALFMLGMTFLLTPLAALVGDAIYFLFFTIMICNFLPELAINVIAAPAIYRVTHVMAKKMRK